jgi:BspA type Leucine rich repeat region (6 copies)
MLNKGRSVNMRHRGRDCFSLSKPMTFLRRVLRFPGLAASNSPALVRHRAWAEVSRAGCRSVARTPRLGPLSTRLRTACATWLLPLLLLTPPAALQAQFNFTTNNGTITITGYNGSGGAVTIPDTTNGYPVTNIGTNAFFGCTTLASVTIPNSVTSIGDNAFCFCESLRAIAIPDSVTTLGDNAFCECSSLTSISIGTNVTSTGHNIFLDCTSLTSVAIPNSFTSIGGGMFSGCISLTNVTIPDSVASIETGAFFSCTSLTNITIPDSVTSFGTMVFNDCHSLTGVYFEGNAPSPFDWFTFNDDNHATVYYLPGTTGWDSTIVDRPIALWLPQMQTSGRSLGMQTNQFGLHVTWASGMTIVVEACTNLANPNWYPVATNTLAGGSSYFSDPQWTIYPVRFYRLRLP